MAKVKGRLTFLAAAIAAALLITIGFYEFESTESATDAVQKEKDPYILKGPLRQFQFATTEEKSLIHYPLNRSTGFSIAELLDLCHYGESLHITKDMAIFGSIAQKTYNYLTTCYPIEISTSQSGRSMGHCSDFVQYIYYADARLSIEFGADTFERKAVTCPRSTFLHGEYANEPLIKIPGLRNYWMPNLEQIRHEHLWYFRNVTKVLCKTKIMCEAAQKLMDKEEITNVPAVYMSHSSPDPVTNMDELFGKKQATKMKEKQNFKTFFHSYGHSGRKSTFAILDCWTWHHGWPTLTIVGNYEREMLRKRYGHIPRNWKVYERVSIKKLRELQAANGIHIASSMQEGYGHYINEARAMGALVLTTDWAPMNEFVKDGESGLLINHEPPKAEVYQGMAPYFISPVSVNETGICDVIKRTLALDVPKRKEMGRKAREAYEFDTRLMISNLETMKKEAIQYLKGEK
ncbi:UNVERIFIED_CONTAM: hypothetical protein HDU68_004439 [Siphonaria sp. JEL0065]|nr:hypothetical protein HDU68_004439 [Siphonaria sp. JEL0065]